MAKLSTIREIMEQEDDTLVMLCRGTVTNVYPESEGDNAQGHWSLQNIEIKDATGTIKVKLKNRPASMTKADKGKVIEIAAFHSDNHGWIGSTAKDDTYKNKTTRILYVTASAEITFPQDGPPAKQAAPQRRTEATEERRPVDRQPAERQPDAEPPTDSGAAHPLAGPRHWFMQWANCYVLAFDAAVYVADQIDKRHGVKLSTTDIKDVATSASIGFAKEMDIAGLPARPLPQKSKPAVQGELMPQAPKPKPEPPPAPKPTPPDRKWRPGDADDPQDDIPF